LDTDGGRRSGQDAVVANSRLHQSLLSWQQQFPALNIPLIAVAGRKGFGPYHPDEESQQQQQ